MVEKSSKLVVNALQGLGEADKEQQVRALTQAFIGSRTAEDFAGTEIQGITESATVASSSSTSTKFEKIKAASEEVAKAIIYDSALEKLAEILDQTIEIIDKASPKLHRSIIHSDPNLANCLFHNSADKPQLVDWDLCGEGSSIYDVAYMLNINTDTHVYRNKEQFIERAAGILGSYQQKRRLSEAEWQALPYVLPVRTLHSVIHKFSDFTSLLEHQVAPERLVNPVPRLQKLEKEINEFQSKEFMESFRNKANPLEFLNEYFSDTYLINLDRSRNRHEAFKKWAGRTGINFTRFPAFDGVAKLSDEDVYHVQGNLPDGGESCDTPDLRSKKAKYGCSRSHYEVIAEAIKHHKTNDDRFVAVFEDDCYIAPEHAEFLKEVMPRIPKDAAMVYLGAIPKLRKGFLPISTEIDGVTEVSSAYGAHCILYNPKVLYVIKDVYEANLNATRLEGGVIPSDRVLAIIQSYIQLGIEDDSPEYKNVISAFQVACKKYGIKEQDFKIYATNPLVAGSYKATDGNGLADSILEGRTVDRTYEQCVGLTLQTLSRDEIIALHQKIEELKQANNEVKGNRKTFRDDMKSILEPFARREGEIQTFQQLMAALNQKKISYLLEAQNPSKGIGDQ